MASGYTGCKVTTYSWGIFNLIYSEKSLQNGKNVIYILYAPDSMLDLVFFRPVSNSSKKYNLKKRGKETYSRIPFD